MTTAVDIAHIVANYSDTTPGMKSGLKAITYIHFWSNLFAQYTGYTPSAEFGAAARLSANTKNFISAFSIPNKVNKLAHEVDKLTARVKAYMFPEEGENHGEFALVTKSATTVAQETLALSSPVYDATELWDKAITPLSGAAKDLLGKVNFTALLLFMGWQGAVEFGDLRSNMKILRRGSIAEQYFRLGVIKLANCVSYFALAALKLFHLFGGYAIPVWGYMACVTVGLITTVGGDLYKQVIQNRKEDALLPPPDIAVADDPAPDDEAGGGERRRGSMTTAAGTKDTFDRVAAYSLTTEGAGGFFDAIGLVARYARYFSLTPSQIETSIKVSSTADILSGALAWPELIGCVNSCRHSFSLRIEDENSKDEFLGLFKQVVVDGCNAIGTACEGLRTFSAAGLLPLAQNMPYFSAAISGTAVITDSVGMYSAAMELQEEDLKSEDLQIQRFKFVKHLSHWGASLITLASLACARAIVPFGWLVCSSVYLISKIALFISEKKKNDESQNLYQF